MFLSYKYLSNLGFNKEAHLYSWEYLIVDDDFRESGIGSEPGTTITTETVVAVIDTYEKLNLLVIPNLIRAILFLNKETSWSIESIVRHNILINTKFHKYSNDIKKYLVLM